MVEAVLVADLASAKIVKYCCGIVDDICNADWRHVERVSAAGLVHALRSQRASAATVTAACSALCSIATAAAQRKAIVASGGCAAIVDALATHSADAKAAAAACKVLAPLAARPAYHDAIEAAGGIAAMVSVLCQHESSEPVVTAASTVIRHLATTLPLRDALLSASLQTAGAESAVRAAMRWPSWTSPLLERYALTDQW